MKYICEHYKECILKPKSVCEYIEPVDEQYRKPCGPDIHCDIFGKKKRAMDIPITDFQYKMWLSRPGYKKEVEKRLKQMKQRYEV